jgi:hypothetical protein
VSPGLPSLRALTLAGNPFTLARGGGGGDAAAANAAALAYKRRVIAAVDAWAPGAARAAGDDGDDHGEGAIAALPLQVLDDTPLSVVRTQLATADAVEASGTAPSAATPHAASSLVAAAAGEELALLQAAIRTQLARATGTAACAAEEVRSASRLMSRQRSLAPEERRERLRAATAEGVSAPATARSDAGGAALPKPTDADTAAAAAELAANARRVRQPTPPPLLNVAPPPGRGPSGAPPRPGIARSASKSQSAERESSGESPAATPIGDAAAGIAGAGGGGMVGRLRHAQRAVLSAATLDGGTASVASMLAATLDAADATRPGCGPATRAHRPPLAPVPNGASRADASVSSEDSSRSSDDDADLSVAAREPVFASQLPEGCSHADPAECIAAALARPAASAAARGDGATHGGGGDDGGAPLPRSHRERMRHARRLIDFANLKRAVAVATALEIAKRRAQPPAPHAGEDDDCDGDDDGSSGDATSDGATSSSSEDSLAAVLDTLGDGDNDDDDDFTLGSHARVAGAAAAVGGFSTVPALTADELLGRLLADKEADRGRLRRDLDRAAFERAIGAGYAGGSSSDDAAGVANFVAVDWRGAAAGDAASTL